MSKVKGDKKTQNAAKTAKPLSTVKEGRVTKPLQAPKAKAKGMAKKAASQHEEIKQMIKAPTKESDESASDDQHDADTSDSDASDSGSDENNINGKAASVSSDSEEDSEEDSDESSESESEVEVELDLSAKVNGNNDDNSETSSSDSDSSEASRSPEKAAIATAHPAALKRYSCDENDSSESDSEDEDSESDEENEVAKANSATKAGVESSDEEEDEDEDSDEEDKDDNNPKEDEDEENDDEEAKPASKKRKAEPEPAFTAKKTKTEEEANGRECNNLFVGNLSWNVDEEWLTREFDGFGELIRVQLVTDRNSGRSKGFGFVQFKEVSAAIEAYNTMSGSVVDGRPMNVDYAPPKEGSNSNNATPRDKYKERAERFGDKQNPPSDTVYVGNLSFDATPDMVREIFEQYGEVTRCALPTDPESGNPKGFAYVGFTSIEDATSALNAMKGESIAGRPIRLDFATPRDGNNSSPRGGRGGFGNRGGPRGRGRFGGRGGGCGGRGGFGRGGGRGGSTNRGGFGDYKGSKVSFD